MKGDLANAIQRATEVAGNKDVTIIGSVDTVQHCLNVELADELHVDIIPRFLHRGFRPFENIKTRSIQIERTKVVELPNGRTHLRFRFVK